MSCVNPNLKEFKDCCKRLNVSPTTLEPIIHEYINIEGNEGSFPSDAYIEDRIHGRSMPVLSDEQVQLWENKYSGVSQFDNILEAVSYSVEAEQFFPREAIGIKETLDGKVEVNIARPFVENYYTEKGIIQKFKKSLFRGQGGKPYIDEGGNLVLTATYDNLFKNYGKSFATSISDAYHYGEITSNNPYIIEVDVEYLDTIIPLNESARTTDKGVRSIGDEYGGGEHEERLQYDGKILIPKGKYKISRNAEDFSKIKTRKLLYMATEMFNAWNSADELMFAGEYSRLTKGISSYSDIKDVFNEVEKRIGKDATSYAFALYSKLNVFSSSSIYDNRKDVNEIYEQAIKEGFLEYDEESETEYFSSKFFTWLRAQEELQTIKKEAIANGQIFLKEDDSFDYALAPNGKKSNLNERQWLHVRTKAFKEWFGDWTKITRNDDGSWNIPEGVSHVINQETGEPLVVYHHTDNPNLTKFSTDFDNYFSKDGGTKKAIFFDEEKTGTLNRKYDIPVFLNIKELNEYNETKAQLHEKGTTYREVVNLSAEKNDVTGGVHMKNFDDNQKENQSIWIIHNANQVKSAEYNEGYSLEDDNIYHNRNLHDWYWKIYNDIKQNGTTLTVKEINNRYGTNFGWYRGELTTRDPKIHGVSIYNNNDTEVIAKKRIDRAVLLNYLSSKFGLTIKEISNSESELSLAMNNLQENVIMDSNPGNESDSIEKLRMNIKEKIMTMKTMTTTIMTRILTRTMKTMTRMPLRLPL